MKKIYYLLALAGLLSSCEATTPPNNAEDKGHDEAHEVEFTFTPGHLNNVQGIYATEFTPSTTLPSFSIHFENDEDGHDHDHSRAIDTEGEARLKADIWYKLDIKLINLNEKNINHTILDYADQRSMHQFFFLLWKDDQFKEKETQKYVEYRYGDVDSNGNLFESPIGFTGYIKVSADMPQRYLQTILVHITPPGTKRKGRDFYAFDAPEAKILTSTDVMLLFPISVEK